MSVAPDLHYRALLGVHHRRKVLFSAEASPARTMVIARPYRLRARCGFLAGFAVSRIAGHRATLPPAIANVLASLDLSADEACLVFRSHDPSERVVIGLGQEGVLEWVIKSEKRESRSLRNEATMLNRLGSQAPGLAPTLARSELIGDRMALIQHAIPRDNAKRFGLSEIVKICIELAELNVTHGDLAEWNLVRSPTRVVLCDWESGSEQCIPFHDLAHFVVQSGSLLGRWSSRRALHLLCGPESPGTQYATQLGLAPTEQRLAVIQYLERSLSENGLSGRPSEYRRSMLSQASSVGIATR
jgi:hypothetical protein